MGRTIGFHPDWAEEIWLAFTPGNETDFEEIRNRRCADYAARFQIMSVGILTLAVHADVAATTHREGSRCTNSGRRRKANFSPAIRNELDAAMRSGRLRHDAIRY